MRAVFRHEVSSYFTHISGYVFGAFILLFTGIYTMVCNISARYTNFEYVLGSMAFIFLIAVPILTMRVIAEERKQKTDQLLYSLPLGMGKVVLGKYLALLVMLALPMVIICLYPLVLGAFGSVHFPTAYGAVVGFFFLGAALISIGVFISSVTENPVVALGVCFAVMLLNYFVADLATYVPSTAYASLEALFLLVLLLAVIVWRMTRSTVAGFGTGIVLEAGLLIWYRLDSTAFEGLFSSIMKQLSLFERFDVFVNGVFDLKALVYDLTVIGLFLFLSVQSMEKRRWSE